MTVTKGEQATINFYQWEIQGRGWYLFDNPVDIEPPYRPFEHLVQYPTSYDDGRVPNFFDKTRRHLSPKKEEIQEEPEELKTRYLTVDDLEELVGFSLSFPHEQEIRTEVCVELLNVLTFTKKPISFEIIGTGESITVQVVCGVRDKIHIRSHIQAYFPTVLLNEIQTNYLGFCSERNVAISDFGTDDIFVQPLDTPNNFTIDPLTSMITNMEQLETTDTMLFQVIFKGVTAPWSRDILKSVSDGQGGSFFVDAPDMPSFAKEKVSNSLFSVVMRVAAQGINNARSEYLATQLIQSISNVSSSCCNKLLSRSGRIRSSSGILLLLVRKALNSLLRFGGQLKQS